MPDPATALVTTSVSEGIAHVRLNRPEKLNALTLQTLDELIETARELRRDRELRAVVISGEGDSFCAGLDFASVLKKPAGLIGAFLPNLLRSEERRVGKACGSPFRSRWSSYH